MANLKEVGIGWDPNDNYQIKIVKQRARMAVKKAWRQQMRVEPTTAEKAMKVLLKSLGVNFTHQAIVHGFIPDFWCAAFGVIVEVDGTSHHDRFDYDAWRDGILRTKKLAVVRFSNNEVFSQPKTCVARVESALRHQAARFTKKRLKRLLDRTSGPSRVIVENGLSK